MTTTELDLSKLDWETLAFPDWKGRKVTAACALVGKLCLHRGRWIRADCLAVPRSPRLVGYPPVHD